MDVTVLNRLLKKTKYDPVKTEFLIRGFSEGFEIGYCGNENVKMTSPNLKLHVGTHVELWNKVMKEGQRIKVCRPLLFHPL